MKLKTVAFDVIQTLFDIEPLEKKLKATGLPNGSLEVWFARVLRDAFALEVSGEYKTFREVASAALEVLSSEYKIDMDKSTIQETIKAFADLPPHPDLKAAFEMPPCRSAYGGVNEWQRRDNKENVPERRA